MPGRWRGGRELQLSPMDFPEWLEMCFQAGWLDSRSTETPEFRRTGLEHFFRIGGFPAALAEAGSDFRNPVQARKTYWQWLRGDCLKFGKQEIYLVDLLGQLANKMQTPVSLQALARDTQIGSFHTAQSYISLLEDCYALHPARRNWEEQVAELVAANFLLRQTQYQDRLGYFHSKDGEIDFYVRGKAAIEVKWSSQMRNLSKAYLRMTIPFKKVWTQNNFLSLE